MAAAPEDLREVPEVHIRPMMEMDLPRARPGRSDRRLRCRLLEHMLERAAASGIG